MQELAHAEDGAAAAAVAAAAAAAGAAEEAVAPALAHVPLTGLDCAAPARAPSGVGAAGQAHGLAEEDAHGPTDKGEKEKEKDQLNSEELMLLEAQVLGLGLRV
jgi:opacity protein-like surface antigen